MLLRRSIVLLVSLTATLALMAPAPASASQSPSEIVKAALKLDLGDSVGYSAAATGSLTDPVDAPSTRDIASTSLNFDTNRINITVTTRSTPVIDDRTWAMAQLSFNRNQFFDGMIVHGRFEASGALTTEAFNAFGIQCPATATTTGNDITMSVDARCMGSPGAVAYSVAYGDFFRALDDPTAIDLSPDSGLFTDPAAERGGYWLLGADGGVFAFGDAPFFGSTGNLTLNQPVVAMSSMPNAGGYRFVASDGGIFSYGNAGFFGSMGGTRLNQPVVGMATTTSGAGYWLVASDGGIFAFGDATFFGSMGGKPLNKPIVGMAPTSTGRGYWLVASDGGIFAFGDARFFGSTGSITLNRPITAMAATPDGAGYNLLASDGGVFTYGNARFFGSGVGSVVDSAVAMSLDREGYLIADAVGGVHVRGATYNFGDIPQLGVLPNKPTVGMAMATVPG